MSDEPEPLDVAPTGLVVCKIGLVASLPCWALFHGFLLAAESYLRGAERLGLYVSWLYVPAVALGFWRCAHARPDRRRAALLWPPGLVALVLGLFVLSVRD